MSKTLQRHFIVKINSIHHNSVKSENYSNGGGLINTAILGYYADVVAKSTAEPENSNDLYLANSSTPFNRAFFVRSSRTPKERLKMACSSMVACNGKGSPFAVFQVSQFLSPLHAIAQTLRSLAVALKKSYLELSAMIYKFLLTGTKRLKITIHANSKAEALNRVHFTSKPLLVARLRNELVKNPQNMTACDTEQNHRLPSVGGCGYDDFTNSLNGNRSRYTSGLFLPQIYTSQNGKHRPKSIEFAVRSIRGNKASNRTNNTSLFSEVVEAVSQPIQLGDTFLKFTKTLNAMNKPTQTPNGRNANATPIVISSRIEGVQYA